MTTKRVITFLGEEYALLGEAPAVGSPAPDFRLWYFNKGEEGSPFGRDDLLERGRPLLLSVITSVDTPVGKIQARKFDRLLRPIHEDVTAVLVSSDLPFTLNRFKETERLKHLIGLSDYLDQSFGRAFGVVIEEPLILARAVFVIDAAGIVQYEQVVPEITDEPDYAAAMATLKSLLPVKPAGQKRRASRRRAPAAPKRAAVARMRPAARAKKATAGRRRR
ncbi:MAG: thiol peroxidase [Planctomycetes bacterium]|nr:thiol peroxidase [Planctomycetota bacterium]MBM4058281.1 thiol peroxidase [Planctomycetota bacterium]